MATQFIEDIEKGMYKDLDSISSLIPYLYEDIAYSLHIDADPILRKYIVAAICKYKNKEISYEDILNSLDASDYSCNKACSQHEQVRHVLVQMAVMTSKIVNKFFDSGKMDSFAKGLFAFSMERLSSSYKVAEILLNHGFYVEVATIFRLILEQLTWGCYLLEEKDESQIMKNKTQQNVKYLKNRFGEKYGSLYGYLSSAAHIEPEEIINYLHIDGNKISIKERSGKECEEDTMTLLLLLQLYGDVVWEGMNQFGFPETDNQYYRDWYDSQRVMVASLLLVLRGKAKIESVNGLDEPLRNTYYLNP